MSASAIAEQAGEEQGSSMGLGDILAMLRRHVVLIISLTVIATGLAAVTAWTTAPTYEAMSTVLVDPRKKTIVKNAEVVSELPADTPTVESEVELLSSKTTMALVIERLNLRHDPEFNKERIRTKLLRMIGLASTQPAAATACSRKPRSRRRERSRSRRNPRDLREERQGRAAPQYLSDGGHGVVSRSGPGGADRQCRRRSPISSNSCRTNRRSPAKPPAGWSRSSKACAQRVVEADRAIALFKAENGIIDTEHGQRLDERQIARLMESLVLVRSQAAEAQARSTSRSSA